MPNYQTISDNAVVLGRIDYGEKDRIITVLTKAHGKQKAIAKAVRSPKSKLAGGIELFAENELVLIVGKGDLCTLRSSRMHKYFGNIVSDIDRTAFAYECLKNVNKLTVDEEGSEYYPFLFEALSALDNSDLPLSQIIIWFHLKLLDLRGVSPNLKTLADQNPIPPNKKYNFDHDHQCFAVHDSGKYTQNHIKILRFFSQKNNFISINKCPDKILNETSFLAQCILREYL